MQHGDARLHEETNHSTGYLIKQYIVANLILPQYTLSHSKLFVWNMTQYDSLLWLDSDTVVADSLHTIFLKVDG